MLYYYIDTRDAEIRVPAWAVIASALFGLISLFTYQSGFGCFFIPLVLHLVSNKRPTRRFWFCIAASLAWYAVYYLLFKLMLHAYDIPASDRTSLYINPLFKLAFFFKKPMASAFHFTLLFNEHSIPGFMLYVLLFGSWLRHIYRKPPYESVQYKLRLIATVCGVFVLMYLPSLLVYESYSSNRTLLALDMAVFLVFFEMIFSLVRTGRTRAMLTGILALTFITNSWYNFHYEFLTPITQEYGALRSAFQGGYTNRDKEICFVRAPQDLFEHKYGIARSWDEFGVPSSFPDWMPESFCRQIIYEKTKDRKLADSIHVKSWPDREAYLRSGAKASDSTLVLDAEEIIMKN